MIKYLLFDIDGTIWNSTPIVAKAWNRAVKELGCSKAVVTGKMLEKEFGQTMDVIGDHLFGDVADPKKRKELLDRCCDYEHQELMENGEDLTYPGMRRTMERLAKKYQLYIVSNCQKGYIELVMEKTGIGGLIADYDCFGNTHTGKGETIRIVLERNRIPRRQAVYIGDIQGDQEAAAQAGIAFLHAAYGFGRVEGAEAWASSFAELEEAVDRLSERLDEKS